MTVKGSPVPPERIASRIYLIRGQKVMLDFDLAELYGVETRALNQAVSRNIDRFPEDFAFQFTREEFDALMSQIVISNAGRGSLPFSAASGPFRWMSPSCAHS
jgi:ORF6N domain